VASPCKCTHTHLHIGLRYMYVCRARLIFSILTISNDSPLEQTPEWTFSAHEGTAQSQPQTLVSIKSGRYPVFRRHISRGKTYASFPVVNNIATDPTLDDTSRPLHPLAKNQNTVPMSKTMATRFSGA